MTSLENHIQCKELDRRGALRGIQAFCLRHWGYQQKPDRKVLSSLAKLLPLDGPKATCMHRKV